MGNKIAAGRSHCHGDVGRDACHRSCGFAADVFVFSKLYHLDSCKSLLNFCKISASPLHLFTHRVVLFPCLKALYAAMFKSSRAIQSRRNTCRKTFDSLAKMLFI